MVQSKPQIESSRAAESVPLSVRVSDREAKCLVVLAEHYSDDFGYLRFSTIQTEAGLDRTQVRRSVRALARKGLAQFSKGLWTDDGTPAGSGYACTEKGLEVFEAQLRTNENAPDNFSFVSGATSAPTLPPVESN